METGTHPIVGDAETPVWLLQAAAEHVEQANRDCEDADAVRAMDQLENLALRSALQDLAWRHGWHDGYGPCLCAAHRKVTELGISYETPATEESDSVD